MPSPRLSNGKRIGIKANNESELERYMDKHACPKCGGKPYHSCSGWFYCIWPRNMKVNLEMSNEKKGR